MVILEDNQADAIRLFLNRVNLVGEEAPAWITLNNVLSNKQSSNEIRKLLAEKESAGNVETSLQEQKSEK